MQQLATAIIATVSLLTLVIYDFLCICRIVKKEKWAERVWRYVLPKKRYNEMLLFFGIRPIFLTTSMITFMLSGGVLSQIIWFRVILLATPLLAVGTSIANSRKR